MSEARTILVAGRGYLGSEIERQAAGGGWRVAALSKSGDDGSLACDLSDREAVLALRERVAPPSCTILSASSGRGGADAYRAVFVDGSRHLLEAFPDTHLLFVSSTSVYGQVDGERVDEESPAEPDRETSRLLLEAEQVVLGARGTVARLAGIYGPGRSVILQKFLSGEAVIEEDGRRYLNQIHRDDAARALRHLAAHPQWSRGEIYNVADSTPLHQADCYAALAAMFDKPLPPSGPKPENRKRAWTHKEVRNDKLRATGWEPRYPSFLDAAREVAETLTD